MVNFNRKLAITLLVNKILPCFLHQTMRLCGFYALQHVCYSAYTLYALARPSVHPSIRLSVRRVYHRKTVEVRIMKLSAYGSPIPLVMQDKFHPEILRGSPQAGASNKGGVGKISSFLCLSVNISKTVADTAKVTFND